MATFDPSAGTLSVDLLILGPSTEEAVSTLHSLARLAWPPPAPRGVRLVAGRSRVLAEVICLDLAGPDRLRVRLALWGCALKPGGGGPGGLLSRRVDGALVSNGRGPAGAPPGGEFERLTGRVPVVSRSEGGGALPAALERLVKRVLARTYRDVGLAAHGIRADRLQESVCRSVSEAQEVRGDGEGPLRANPLLVAVPVSDAGDGKGNDDWLGALLEAARLSVSMTSDVELARDRADRLQRTLEAAAHDLRKPVTALTSFLYLLGAEAERLSPRARDALEASREVVVSLEKTIGQALDLPAARDSCGATEEVVDLGRLVEEVTDRLRFLAAREGITVRTRALPAIRGDRAALASLFTNLLGNALKYSDPRKAQRSVEIGSRSTVRDGILLYVADNGIGVPEEDRRRVWYRQARASNVGDRAGQGLGLAIVDDVARRHGGRVRLVSREGEGTLIAVRLPSSRRVRSKASTTGSGATVTGFRA